MTKMFKLLFVIGFITIQQGVFSQTTSSPYEVATWPGFREAAINYTFDDGCANQFKIAIPLFDEFNFKLTLFTASSWVTNWSVLQSASKNGHEIASHTVTHPDFGKISLEKQIEELKNSKDTIDQHVTNTKCITIAYPFCVPGNNAECAKYYISARGCQGFIESKTPQSYYNISSIGAGSVGTIKTLDNFKTQFISAAKKNGWCVFLFHGIDNDGGYSPINSLELRKSILYLNERKSKYWVNTFVNTTLYCKERNAVTIKEVSANDESKILEITDTLDNTIYNYPISVRCPLPTTWPSADVTQNGKEVTKRIVKINSIIYIYFDIIPDAGKVEIKRNANAVTPEVDTIPNDNVDPVSVIENQNEDSGFCVNYSDKNITVSLTNSYNNKYDFNIVDLKGAKILTKRNITFNNNVTSIGLNDCLKTGVYLICLTDGKNNWNKKLIVS